MAEEAVDKRVTVEHGIDKPDQAREHAIRRLKQKQDFKGILIAGVFAFVVCVVIWAIGDRGYFWPVWVALGVGIAIVVKGWKAYGPANRITEADVQREMEKG